MISVIDYGASNIRSVGMALTSLGKEFSIINSTENSLIGSHVILPGVGSFHSAMKTLEELNLVRKIHDFHKQGGVVIGICLGMQLLFESSEEFSHTEGLGLIKGQVTPNLHPNGEPSIRIGWDKVIFTNPSHLDGNYFFAHSYQAHPMDKNSILAMSIRNDREVVAAVRTDRAIGFQFHPEKSSKLGLRSLDWALKSF